jgi:hypothetical protein
MFFEQFLSRIKPKYDVLADTVLTLPWGSSS